MRSFPQLTADKRLLIEVCMTDKSFYIYEMYIAHWQLRLQSRNSNFCGMYVVAGWQSALYRFLTASSLVLPTYLHVLSLWRREKVTAEEGVVVVEARGRFCLFMGQ